ncbi:MAG TPA: hypothetical protein VNO70_21790 [Blastocatellia bacterium]|nr:hypothetical protein [Blastocatellia bacterium]
MTNEQVERAIEFLLDHHAKFSADIGVLKELQTKTTVDVQSLTASVADLTEAVARLEAQAESDRQEIREAINNLIIANEVTRDLAQNVAKLAIATSQRVTKIEERLSQE